MCISWTPKLLSPIHPSIFRLNASHPEAPEKERKFEWTEECDKAFKAAKETLMRNPILYNPDPNTLWIIKTDASKTAYADVLLQLHIHDRIKQDVPVTFISYNFTGTQQAWECHRKRTQFMW